MDNKCPKTYYETHKDDWYVKVECDICSGSYSRASRYNHLKTRKHQDAIKYKKIENKLKNMDNVEDAAAKFEDIQKKLNDIKLSLENFAQKN